MIAEFVTVLGIIPTGLVAFYVWLLQSRKGTLPITTTDCAYDRNKYGQILNWDKYCLYIHGNPTLMFSGEFHYLRLPDRSRHERGLSRGAQSAHYRREFDDQPRGLRTCGRTVVPVPLARILRRRFRFRHWRTERALGGAGKYRFLVPDGGQAHRGFDRPSR